MPLHYLVQASPGRAVKVVRGHVSTQKHRRWPVRRVVCVAISVYRRKPSSVGARKAMSGTYGFEFLRYSVSYKDGMQDLVDNHGVKVRRLLIKTAYDSCH